MIPMSSSWMYEVRPRRAPIVINTVAAATSARRRLWNANKYISTACRSRSYHAVITLLPRGAIKYKCIEPNCQLPTEFACTSDSYWFLIRFRSNSLRSVLPIADSFIAGIISTAAIIYDFTIRPGELFPKVFNNFQFNDLLHGENEISELILCFDHTWQCWF